MQHIGSNDFLPGGGEAGALIRSLDWSQTPLGTAESWPQSLRTALSICLQSRFPILIWWGSEMVMLYNDAYRPMLGSKHPRSMGQPGRECWVEVWHIIGPMLEGVMERGEATWSEDQMLPLERHGYAEECYFTFSYSPIRDESGGIGGIFCAVTETTERVIGERQLSTLGQLSATAKQTTVEMVCREAVRVLAANPHDIPFALIYLADASGKSLRLEGAAGLEIGSPLAPAHLDLSGKDPWPAGEVFRSGESVMLTNLPLALARTAMILPITSPGHEGTTGVLVAGISPSRPFGEKYRSFLGLIADHVSAAIADARAYEMERKRAEALAEVDRAKTVFFSNVSHEFRTPLTLMLGPLEEEIRESVGPLRERLELVHRNSLRLLRLVNTLLDFSRIEAGRMDAVYEPTDLARFTADLASVFRSAIEKAGLKLIVDCPPLSGPVHVDRDMWEKIVFNLLSNALKFTFEGEIEIRVCEGKGSSADCDTAAISGNGGFSRAASPSAKAVRLSVRDTGTGIPAAEIPRLFERFRRLRNAHSRSHEGTGIGLALVRELARLHGGGVQVESVEGDGTTFTVSIPMGTAHLPKDQIGATRELSSAAACGRAFVEEALRWLPEPSAAAVFTRSTTGNDARENAGDPHACVLLADDNRDMREYVQRLLTGHGHHVITVADGLAALEAARANPPSLMLCDVMMPRLDGFGLISELRTDPRTNTIPIILLSARAGEDARVEGMDQGADDYLTKPFSARELLACVDTHLKLAQVRRKANEVIVESEERFRLVADAAPVLIWIAGADKLSTYLNRGWLDFIGRTNEQELGNDRMEHVHPGDRARCARLYETSFDARQPFEMEYRLRHRSGEYRWVFDRGVPRYAPNGAFEGYIGGCIDVHEQKRASDALREQFNLFKTLTNNSTQAILMADAHGCCTFMNPAAEAMFGYAFEEMQFRRLHELVHHHHPDGRPYPLAECPIHCPQKDNRKVREHEDLFIRKNGEFFPVSVAASPIFDDQGRPVSTVIEIRDITERKRADEALIQAKAELERTNQNLETTVMERTAKLRDTIGELEAFSYSISHDMRSPLRAMQGYADALQLDYKDRLDADGQHYLERIRLSASRMDLLIQDVLAYSKVAQGDVELVQVDVEAVLQEVVQNYPQLQPRNTRVVVDGPLPKVVGHQAYLTQIVSNLLGNAVKFVAPGVLPQVTVRAELDGNDRVTLWFEDNGIGIDPRHHADIFQIFGRVYADKKYEGTGIGLAIVKKAAERMGGAVGVASVLGQGSRFWITLKKAS